MSGGVAKALSDVLDGEDEEDALAQAGLFDDLDESETGALDAPSPLSALVQPRRGPGRRPGSKNRRTEQVTAWLLSQGRHPLLVMMETYGMTPAELAGRLGLEKAWGEKTRTLADGKVEKTPVQLGHYDNGVLLELYKLQLRMAEALAPYVAQRQPLAVAVDAKGSLNISFEGVSLPARGALSGKSGVVEGEVMQVRLPYKSDAGSRTDD